MPAFDYSKLCIFDKNGRELPLTINSSYKITVPSKNGKPAIFYPIANNAGKIVNYKKESSGTRFSGEDSTVNCFIGDVQTKATVEYESYSVINDEGDSNPTQEYSIKNITDIVLPFEKLEYPSATLNSFINFKPVSTELVETESLYIFVKNENGEYEKISNYDPVFSNRYELLFFIDCRSQKEFQIFEIENDDVIWTDRVFASFDTDNENSYRVNIGFKSSEEGTFKETLHICLIDRGDGKRLDRKYADITIIGSIELNAESIGEDERYRTLFTNFGIPDPKEYANLFANTSAEDDNTDNILLNQNSKKMFLAYPEIFPYVGTYKALVNAVDVLGYDDIFFKEWYKRTGSGTKSGYTAYDMTYNSDIKANIINNVPFEERIHLKKLNWLSMVYKINKEIANSPEDKYGFPLIENNYDFSHEDIIVKLVSLRDWLQKYIIGVNCRIIDVGGEGIYFERYFNGAYGTYEQAISWDNENNVSPMVVEHNGTSDGYIYSFMKQVVSENGELVEVEAQKSNFYADWEEHRKNYNNPKPNYLVETGNTIRVYLGLNSLNDTLEKYKDKKFLYFIDGYIEGRPAGSADRNLTARSRYYRYGYSLPGYSSSEPMLNIDPMTYVDVPLIAYGNTLQSMSRLTKYQIRASASCDNFIFGEDWVNGSSVWIQNGNIYLSPLDIHNGKGLTADFKITPTVYFKKGTVHVYDSDTGLIHKSVKVSLDGEVRIGKSAGSEGYSKFQFKEEGVHGLPVFILDHYNPFILNSVQDEFTFTGNECFILDIDEGYFTFNGPEIKISEDYLKHFDIVQNEIIAIYFKPDNNGKRTVSVNVIYETQDFSPKSYLIGTSTSIDDFQNKDNIAAATFKLNNYSYRDQHLDGPKNFFKFYTEEPGETPTSNGIIYNDIVPLNVRYAGEYQIDVFGKDLQNNIFAAKCPNTAIVNAPNYSAVTYSNIENLSGEITADEKTKILNDYINYCIYRKEINSLFTKDANSEIGIDYTRHFKTMPVPDAGDYIHFSNKLEKFELNPKVDEAQQIVSTGNSTEEYYELPDGTQVPANEGYIIRLKKSVKDSRYTYNDIPIGNQTYLNSMFDNSDHDVNVVLYNELGGYPVYQSFGILKKDNDNDGWELVMEDASDREYIWILLDNPDDKIEYLKRAGIVTKKVDNKLYYAAAYKKDNDFYYLKTINMSPTAKKFGDSNHSSQTDLNFTFDITKLARMNGIGIYIQPINMVNVVVSNKNPHYDSTIPGSKEELENQLQIQITSARNINVSPGDMVKIIFSSNFNNLHFIQSAYKVVEVSSSYLIVEGKINGAYIRIIGNNIFYNTKIEYNKVAGQTAADFWTNNFIPELRNMQNPPPAEMDINIIDANRMLSIHKPQESETEFDDEGNPKIEYILYTYPACECETVLNNKIRRSTFVALPVLDANGNEPENPTKYNIFEIINTANSEPVRTSEMIQNEDVNTYMTYSHTAYVDYAMQMKDKPIISGDEIHIDIPATRHNKWIFDYVDTKFVFSNRNFDTNNGIYSWMDIIDPRLARIEPFGGKPIIAGDKPIYKYDKPTETPSLDQNNSLLVISPANITNEKLYWKIWKRSTKGNERTLMFESYNPSLYLDMSDTGIYDVEMNVWDKLGNVSTNTIKGAFKVI